jgi:5-methyltetrahydrofolate--homocysteine methyltransferase
MLINNPLSALVKQTENAILPAILAASVAGFYLAHPEARYFAITKIDRDQLEDWAKRTHYPVSEAKKWLAPLL